MKKLKQKLLQSKIELLNITLDILQIELVGGNNEICTHYGLIVD
jgi:hypothetical protein